MSDSHGTVLSCSQVNKQAASVIDKLSLCKPARHKQHASKRDNDDHVNIPANVRETLGESRRGGNASSNTSSKFIIIISFLHMDMKINYLRNDTLETFLRCGDKVFGLKMGFLYASLKSVLPPAFVVQFN